MIVKPDLLNTNLSIAKNDIVFCPLRSRSTQLAHPRKDVRHYGISSATVLGNAVFRFISAWTVTLKY